MAEALHVNGIRPLHNAAVPIPEPSLPTVTQTYRFFRPDMYSRLHRNVATDAAEALQQWVEAEAGRSYQPKGREGESVLYEVTMDAAGADEARNALGSLADVQFMACAPAA